MKILKAELHKYELPLVKSLTIKGQTLNSRNGVILSLKSEDGLTGYGEAAPLPGLEKESLDEAICELLKIKDKLVGLWIHPEAFEFNGGLEKLLPDISLPSVRFSVETAMFDLFVQRDKTFAKLKNADVQVNALIMHGTEKPKVEFKQLLNLGYHVIKIKVGSRVIEEDIEKINRLKQLEQNVTLRLDANRAWELEEALSFCERIGPEQIEYIEEPVSDINAQADFIKKSKIHLALDETLTENNLRHLTSLKGIEAFILKPSVLGGLEATAKLIRIARENNIQPVLSSTFQSSVSMRATLFFAVKTGICGVPAGLDTLKWLSEDVLEEKIEISNGRIDVVRLLRKKPKLRKEILTDI